MNNLTTKTNARRTIAYRWHAIRIRARAKGAWRTFLAELPKTPQLLSGNLKINASAATDSREIMIKGLSLSPSTESGFNMCPWATEGCSAACLKNAGQNAMSPAENARLWRTALYLGDRAAFLALLRHEIRAHQRSCERQGKIAAARLDVLSDVGLSERMAKEFPGVRFYDYTKSAKRAMKSLAPSAPSNWHITLSFSGENADDCKAYLRAGGVVSAVFDKLPKISGRRDAETLPEQLWGFAVEDADIHDARFLSTPGTVQGLRFKTTKKRAAALAEAGNFVIRNSPRRLLRTV